MTNLSDTDLVDQLSDRGYAVLRLSRVEDVVLVVRDTEVSPPAHLENKLVVYTLEELIKMGEVGKASQFNSVDYKRLHLVKKLFGGEVVA
jgi:hypothetical protein